MRAELDEGSSSYSYDSMGAGERRRRSRGGTRTGPPAHRAVTITLIALNIYEAHIWATGHVIPCLKEEGEECVN